MMPAKLLPGEIGNLRWAHETRAVFLREIRREWRTRVAVSGTLLFVVGTLALIALALRGSRATSGETAAALLHITLFFAASVGLARTFVLEEERGTGLALRLTASGSTVWAGKGLANLALLLLITLLDAPLLLALLDIRVANIGLLTTVLVLGDIGLAAVFTTTGALVAQASTQGGLLPALSFPLLAPLLLSAVHGSEAALGIGNPSGKWSPGIGDIQVLAAYVVVAITASLMTFNYIWND